MFTNEFTEKIKERLADRENERNLRPDIEVWPGSDDFAEWVASHERRERAVICKTPEYQNTPYCGGGSH